jgi:hypothetical protein
MNHLYVEGTALFVRPMCTVVNLWYKTGILEITVTNIKKKLRGLSPQANYTDQATAVYQRS